MKKFLALVLAAGMFMPVVIGAQEKKTPEETFKALDKNSDGKLSKEEFVGNAEGEKKTKKESRFTALDTNKDGSLSLDEYKAGQKKKDK
jgi:Ca2+-binding EF-hand superfamily protein